MSKKNYVELRGDLVKLAEMGVFEVVIHGCNCFCTMGSGLAPQMAKAFGCDKFPMEHSSYMGDINKLGTIDAGTHSIPTKNGKLVTVVNCYTQYNYGPEKRPQLDYQALTLIFKKLNHIYEDRNLGMPRIGCGLAGGDWEVVKGLIWQYMPKVKVTVVNYDPPAKPIIKAPTVPPPKKGW